MPCPLLGFWIANGTDAVEVSHFRPLTSLSLSIVISRPGQNIVVECKKRKHLISKFCKQEVELPTYEVCIYKHRILQFALSQIRLSIFMIISYLNLSTLTKRSIYTHMHTNAIVNFNSHNLYIIIFSAPLLFSIVGFWPLAMGLK